MKILLIVFGILGVITNQIGGVYSSCTGDYTTCNQCDVEQK